MIREENVMNKEAALVSVTITCPADGKEYATRTDNYDAKFHGWENECETCGSHGGVSLSVTCAGCGKNHNIELDSW